MFQQAFPDTGLGSEAAAVMKTQLLDKIGDFPGK